VRMMPDDLPHGTETVMVVEDKPDVRLFTVSILERLGYTVLEAAHGNDALELLAGRDGPVDLVLTDVVMPEMGGPELVRQLSQVRQGFCVLYTSGYTDPSVLRKGALTPNTPFLEKPYTVDDLARGVRAALDGLAHAPADPA
jgi:two-component system, cell cycle sensor histidine kinase and response regulator CckA